MLVEQISTVHLLVFCAMLGIICAMVITNIKRTAQSRFITYLCNNDIISKDVAVTLSDMGVFGIYALAVKNECSGKYGLSKHVARIQMSGSRDKLEAALEGGDVFAYYLTEYDKDALLKRYSYKTMPLKQLLLFTLALIAAAFLIIFTIQTVSTRAKTNSTDFNNKVQDNTENEQQSNINEDKNEGRDNISDDTPPPPSTSGAPSIPLG